MSSRFIHVVALRLPGRIIFHGMNIPHFCSSVHPSVNTWVVCGPRLLWVMLPWMRVQTPKSSSSYFLKPVAKLFVCLFVFVLSLLVWHDSKKICAVPELFTMGTGNYVGPLFKSDRALGRGTWLRERLSVSGTAFPLHTIFKSEGWPSFSPSVHNSAKTVQSQIT